jgi:hypothetical protein
MAIYVAHHSIDIDACLDRVMATPVDSGTCLLGDEHHLSTGISATVLSVHFVLGLAVSLLSAWIINHIRSAKGD